MSPRLAIISPLFLLCTASSVVSGKKKSLKAGFCQANWGKYWSAITRCDWRWWLSTLHLSGLSCCPSCLTDWILYRAVTAVRSSRGSCGRLGLTQWLLPGQPGSLQVWGGPGDDWTEDQAVRGGRTVGRGDPSLQWVLSGWSVFSLTDSILQDPPCPTTDPPSSPPPAPSTPPT